jgi:hypothetical protein
MSMTHEPTPSQPDRQDKPTIFCKACNYPLNWVAEPRCPECGKPFDLSDPDSFVEPRLHTVEVYRCGILATAEKVCEVLEAQGIEAALEIVPPSADLTFRAEDGTYQYAVLIRPDDQSRMEGIRLEG